MCNRMGPRAIKDYFTCISKVLNEINPYLHEGTLPLHVYHIQGKIIEESPFNAATNDNKLNMLSFG